MSEFFSGLFWMLVIGVLGLAGCVLLLACALLPVLAVAGGLKAFYLFIWL